MTLNQRDTIKYVMKKKGRGSLPETLYLTDAKLQFTDEEIEKCQNIESTDMTKEDAMAFLTLTHNIATWKKQVGTGMCDVWISQLKERISAIHSQSVEPR